MTLKSFIIRLVYFTLPGFLMLLGGPVKGVTEPASGVARVFLPISWPGTFVSSVLICLPGIVFVFAADFLAEITWARGVPLNTTPGRFWVATGYVFAFAMSVITFARLAGFN